MKKSRLILILLVAVGCMTARADALLISLDSPILSGPPGSVVQFFGTLTNTTGADLYLNADNFDLAGFDPSAIDDSPFFTNAPFFLGSGGTSGDIGLFNVTIPNGFGGGNYAGSFEILGGATSDDQSTIGTVDFVVQVPSSAVPEPSSLSMFALVLGLFFVYRGRALFRRPPSVRT